MVRRQQHPPGSWDDWEPGGKSGGKGGFIETCMSEKQLGKLHDAIVQTAAIAVRDIMHLETDKSEGELTKRIVKSAYKAASEPKLLQMPREAAIQELVTRMMQGYTAAFGEAPWFFNINLPPVLCAAAWEIFAAKEHFNGNIYELQDQVAFEYDAQLDRILLDKAYWEVSRTVFGDETNQNKIFQAISRSYWPALDEVLGNLVSEQQLFGYLGPDKELQYVQAFASKWINDAMCRAWVSIEGAERVLTRDSVLHLFQGLICPFGPEDDFTCIPGALTEQIGRPPPDWPFLDQAIAELFANWGPGGHSVDGGPHKKRKKANPWLPDAAERSHRSPEQKRHRQTFRPNKKEPGAKAAPSMNPGGKAKAKFRGFSAKEELVEDGTEAVEEADEEGLETQDGDAAEGGEGGGHPFCTSDEDCIGGPDCKLIQHILRGKPGDMYCQKCWDSFSARNASLQGVEVDI